MRPVAAFQAYCNGFSFQHIARCAREGNRVVHSLITREIHRPVLKITSRYIFASCKITLTVVEVQLRKKHVQNW